MCELLRTRVFGKIAIYKSDASNEAEVKNGLLTVSRLVQCLNPPNFHLKVCRNERNPSGWPAITVDMKSSKSTFFVEADFFTSQALNELEKIAKRIETIHVHRSIYDGDFKSLGEEVLLNTTKLILSGYTNSCDISDLFSVIDRFPKLKTFSLRTGSIRWDRFRALCEQAIDLRSADFTKCFFDSDIKNDQIIQLAGAIKKAGKRSPLRLTFDRIKSPPNYCNYHGSYTCDCYGDYLSQSARQSKFNDIKQVLFSIPFLFYLISIICATNLYECPKNTIFSIFTQAFQNEDVQKYVYVQIGSDPDYD